MTDTNNLFVAAARQKLRFESSKGALTVEDLWDIPLTGAGRGALLNLDDIARGLHRQLKEFDGDVSFVRPVARSVSHELQLKFDVVKFVIDTKVDERDVAQAAAEKAEKKQKILAIIAQKQDQALAGASVEDLQRMLGEL